MSKDGNGGVKVREFAVVVPFTLPSPGRVEDEFNKFSRTPIPKIPTLLMSHFSVNNLSQVDLRHKCVSVVLSHKYTDVSEKLKDMLHDTGSWMP